MSAFDSVDLRVGVGFARGSTRVEIVVHPRPARVTLGSMAVAAGQCPSCGAPIEFGLGSSLAKVCEYCRANVVRSDRGFESLGQVAELAKVPSLVSVGDVGTLAGFPFQVVGRVQLDHGKGPWLEYYVSYASGHWGWLAYDDGKWYATTRMAGMPVPPHSQLQLEADMALGQHGYFRITEAKSGTVVSASGELPEPISPGEVIYYADLRGPGGGLANLDYGDEPDNPAECQLFVGREFFEPELVITQSGPRQAERTSVEQVQCQACGGQLSLLSGARASRLGCGYCGALNDLTSFEIVARQERAHATPEIPLGRLGVFDGAEYLVIAYLRRSIKIEGERYPWEEYLLWAQQLGFRWVTKSEGKWSWALSVNPADLDLRSLPKLVSFGGNSFKKVHEGKARVDYVLGEVFWTCSVGEKVRVTDFAHKGETLSREYSKGEVQWTLALPIGAQALSQGFRLELH